MEVVRLGGSALKAAGQLLCRCSPARVADKAPVVISDARISCVCWVLWSIDAEVWSYRSVSATVLQQHHNQNASLSCWRKWGWVKCSRPGPPQHLPLGHNYLLEAGNGSGVAEHLAWLSLQSSYRRKERLSHLL